MYFSCSRLLTIAATLTLLALPAAHAQPTAPTEHLFGTASAVTPDALERARGTGAEVPAMAAASSATNSEVSRNAATDVSTGANIIQQGSFAGASGMPMVIQNSGANVSIQNATVINLELR